MIVAQTQLYRLGLHVVTAVSGVLALEALDALVFDIVIFASPNTVDHSAKSRLVVIITLVCSYSLARTACSAGGTPDWTAMSMTD